MLAKVSPDERDEARWKERKRHRDIQDCGWSSFLRYEWAIGWIGSPAVFSGGVVHHWQGKRI